jgi:hypothetical protein
LMLIFWHFISRLRVFSRNVRTIRLMVLMVWLLRGFNLVYSWIFKVELVEHFRGSLKNGNKGISRFLNQENCQEKKEKGLHC